MQKSQQTHSNTDLSFHASDPKRASEFVKRISDSALVSLFQLESIFGNDIFWFGIEESATRALNHAREAHDTTVLNLDFKQAQKSVERCRKMLSIALVECKDDYLPDLRQAYNYEIQDGACSHAKNAIMQEEDLSAMCLAIEPLFSVPELFYDENTLENVRQTCVILFEISNSRANISA